MKNQFLLLGVGVGLLGALLWFRPWVDDKNLLRVPENPVSKAECFETFCSADEVASMYNWRFGPRCHCGRRCESFLDCPHPKVCGKHKTCVPVGGGDVQSFIDSGELTVEYRD